MRRWSAVLTVIALAVLLSLGVAGPPPVAAQQLSNDDMLRLVLPVDGAGRRVPVLAWARYDDYSARDGTLQVFVAAFYKSNGPFGSTDLRRVVNHLTWNGRAFVPDNPDDPGEVFEDTLAWFGLPEWKPEIEVTSNRSEGNPVYTVVYKAAGSFGNGASGAITLTEMYRPNTALLWHRVTELRETDPPTTAGQETRVTRVSHRWVVPARGPEQIVADVAESVQVAPPPGRAAQPPAIRYFIETYVYSDRAARFELETRVTAQPAQ
jgi:hypothetical protein